MSILNYYLRRVLRVKVHWQEKDVNGSQSAPLLEYSILLSWLISLSIKNLLGIFVWIYFWVFCSIIPLLIQKHPNDTGAWKGFLLLGSIRSNLGRSVSSIFPFLKKYSGYSSAFKYVLWKSWWPTIRSASHHVTSEELVSLLCWISNQCVSPLKHLSQFSGFQYRSPLCVGFCYSCFICTCTFFKQSYILIFTFTYSLLVSWNAMTFECFSYGLKSYYLVICLF